MNLNEYLKNKPIFYKKIDYDRMPRAFKSIKNSLNLPPIIHIVGTNGKGSTGRFLAQICESLGYLVGHYTSPHIFKFNERFYKNGQIISDDELENAHQILQNLLNDEFKNTLSYFEYATFLAAILFEKCDFVIFEAGMGGEFDATNLFEKRLSLFTPIGLDHTEILGDSLEKISYTKLISMDKFAILNDDMSEISIDIAKKIAIKKNAKIHLSSEILDEFDKREILKYANNFKLAKFQISNLSLSFAATKFLKLKPNLNILGALNLKGRLERVLSNLIVDVGHNPLGAKAILQSLYPNKFKLIYNSFLDKDYKSVLEILKPIVKEVCIYDYQSNNRELATKFLPKVCENLGLKYSNFTQISKDENYLLFGSFMLVEEFLNKELK
ncbi:bifunctional folylpolyglutamate synthase/dihydrofolate synthase [Campylobacter sp. FMV-PI01]|uniref:Bifunctional folylpolyglutamate synthase/dihydrofolate synthase n=1 Tax=Campylobacter portucalensis TaxID=2608384 RepID=A0A6L5WG02_9BACT|nr:Mur ligase family protein [Campylobacter portucalensis]MSN96058.1 bifunctional folylpolyglutamate synthase/dihydrofolate synthase [Campylobacter portucalensis]